METTITSLQNQLEVTRSQLQQAKEEREKAIDKCKGLEEYVAKLGLEFKDNMKEVSCSIEWGTGNHYLLNSLKVTGKNIN